MEPEQPYVTDETVDIYQLPEPDKTPLGTVIVHPDLHGNYMHLVFRLIKQAVMGNITASEYAEWVTLYQKNANQLSRSDLKRNEEIAHHATFRQDIRLIFLGDEVKDRGSNDLPILNMFKILHDNKVPFDILFSNHGLEFLYAYENDLPLGSTRYGEKYVAFFQSAQQLQVLLDRGLVKRDDVIKLVECCYKPHIKLLEHLETMNGHYLLSHARIGLQAVERAAASFNLPYLGNTHLGQMIHQINTAFQRYVKTNTTHHLYDYHRFNLADNVIDHITHNRKPKGLFRPEHIDDILGNKKPMRYVHGHDTSIIEGSLKHIINLDGDLGKSPEHNVGSYNTLVLPAINTHTATIGQIAPPTSQNSPSTCTTAASIMTCAMTFFGGTTGTDQACLLEESNILDSLQMDDNLFLIMLMLSTLVIGFSLYCILSALTSEHKPVQTSISPK